jgi:hypothetical protein
LGYTTTKKVPAGPTKKKIPKILDPGISPSEKISNYLRPDRVKFKTVFALNKKEGMSESDFDSAEADTEVDISSEEEEEENGKKTANIIWSEHAEGFENHETDYEIADRVTEVKKYLDGKDIQCIPNSSIMTGKTRKVFRKVQGENFIP